MWGEIYTYYWLGTGQIDFFLLFANILADSQVNSKAKSYFGLYEY